MFITSSGVVALANLFNSSPTLSVYKSLSLNTLPYLLFNYALYNPFVPKSIINTLN